jgi:hypothetical protein
MIAELPGAPVEAVPPVAEPTRVSTKTTKPKSTTKR